MNTQKLTSKSASSQAESLNVITQELKSGIGLDAKLHAKQKAKRPNYMLRLL
jgi:hypothetical protein